MLGVPVRVVDCEQGGALGSAIMAAVASGAYASVEAAIDAMAAKVERVYEPAASNQRIYQALYEEYARLHDYFGRGENDVMKRLKHLRSSASEQRCEE